MRKFSEHTPEQIVMKMDKAEALRGEGMSMAWPAVYWTSARQHCADVARITGR